MIIPAKFLIVEPVFRQDLKRLLDAGEQPAVQVNGHPLIGRLLGLERRRLCLRVGPPPDSLFARWRAAAGSAGTRVHGLPRGLVFGHCLSLKFDAAPAAGVREVVESARPSISAASCWRTIRP